MRAAFFSEEGFHSGYFLGILDADIIQVTPNKFTWSVSSTHLFVFSNKNSN